ncbi:MAG TPA: DMT family transporter [Methanomassiliicoccales archaeon]|nr:DMT family transporter [Methanomassiliicoccales archaeon]
MRVRVDKFEQVLLIASLLWGTSFVASKIGVSHVDPYFFGMGRWIIGAAVLVLVALATKTFAPKLFSKPLVWGLGLVNALGLTLQNVGMTQTTATNTVLLVDINVVFVAVISFAVLSERITKYTIYGLLLGLLGVGIVSTGGDLSQMMQGSFVGNVLVFAAGIVWAFYIVYQKKLVNEHVEPIMTSAAVVTTTAVFSIPIALVFASNVALDATGAWSMLYLGVVCTAAAWLLYIMGLRGKGATDSSVILFMEIVFAMVFAFLLLGETPDWFTAIGGVLILLSVLLVSASPNGKKREG